MRAGTSELKPIRLEDREIFERAYKALKFPLADQSFAMAYLCRKLLGIRWMILEKNLCVFADYDVDGSTVLWGPVIPGNLLKETMDECFEMLDSLNKDSRMSKLCYLPEELKEGYEGIDGYYAERQNQDYVYLTRELIELRGEKFKQKRGMANHFRKNYPHEIEDFDSGHEKQCLELLEFWKQEKNESGAITDGNQAAFNSEIDFAKQAVMEAKTLGLKGIVVKIGGKVIGFTLGEELNSEVCSIMVEKTSPRFRGISEFIFNEFLKRKWAGHKYVNTQEDMGVEYLKKSKMRYHPAFLLQSYMVKRK